MKFMLVGLFLFGGLAHANLSEGQKAAVVQAVQQGNLGVLQLLDLQNDQERAYVVQAIALGDSDVLNSVNTRVTEIKYVPLPPRRPKSVDYIPLPPHRPSQAEIDHIVAKAHKN